MKSLSILPGADAKSGEVMLSIKHFLELHNKTAFPKLTEVDGDLSVLKA